jgi:hypothetical protein
MFLPAADNDVPAIVTLMNRAYRGTGAAGWSMQESYLNADRITEDVLRADRSRRHSRIQLRARRARCRLRSWAGRIDPVRRSALALMPAAEQRHGKTGSPIN